MGRPLVRSFTRLCILSVYGSDVWIFSRSHGRSFFLSSFFALCLLVDVCEPKGTWKRRKAWAYTKWL